MNPLVRSSIAEFLGTFGLVFVGGFAAINAGSGGVVVAALGHGMVLIGLIFALGHISGAHFNPAVTVAQLVTGKIDAAKAGVYIVAQLIGAVVAALIVSIVLESSAVLGETTGSLTADKVWLAALFEAVLTFLFVSVIFQVAVFGKAGTLAPIAIGFALMGCILAGGPYTGASLNPARTFGPALIAGNLDYVLPYLVGILAGGTLAGLVQQFVIGEK